MIYVMSQKFFKKNIEKMAEYNPYFILDGENFAITGKADSDLAIASKYNRAHSVGSFSPEMRLYRMLRKMKNGEPINTTKYENEVRSFLKDKSFIAVVNTSFKALIAGGFDNPLNIFVVLPNIVYKYLGSGIVERMRKLAKTDFEFILTQADLESSMKILRRLLNREELKEIDKVTKRIEKKYDLKFLGDTEDEDDD